MTLMIVLLLGTGFLLIYGAVKDRNPIEVVKAVLTDNG